jgi:hypothetical protein
MKVQRR